MLHFLGTGSAFNTELGNNSAVIKENTSLLLIDCGGTVFQRLQEGKLLEGLENLYIVITHTHPDHVGSLGEVILYSYYILGHEPAIFFPEQELMTSYLTCIGVTPEMYMLESSKAAIIQDENFGKFDLVFCKVSHVDTIPAYGFILTQANGALYYSGDANGISDEIVTKLKTGEIDRVYQDTCGLEYEGNAHMSLKKLSEIFREQSRGKVYCMHLDKQLEAQEIVKLGFKIAGREY